MSDTSAAGRHHSGAASGVFYILAVLLISAPLFRGGNRPLPLLALELGTLVLAAYVYWRPSFKDHLPYPLLATLLVLWLCPLLQLIPLPSGLWAALPGRASYAEALSEINNGIPFAGLRAISLVPFATESAWLALLPPLIVFLAAVSLPTRQLQSLIILFLGLASCQAILGLIQYGQGPDSLFHLGHYRDSAIGTYANRNHLAGLLEMALPIGLALLIGTLGRSRRSSHYFSRRRNTWRHRLGRLSQLPLNRVALYAAASLVILLGLIFTRSRTGVSMAMLGILLCILLFSRRLGGNNVYGLVGSVTLIGLGLAIEIGLTPVLDRFTQADPLGDARWSIFSGTLKAIAEFFPLGSGGGTFVEVFRSFRPADLTVDAYVNRAHNDYLEWIMEGGLLAALILVVLLGFYLRQWFRVWRRGSWSVFRCVQVGAGISLLLMLLHSFVDYNLRIPANALFFAFLAAVFFHRQREEEPRSKSRSRHQEPPPKPLTPIANEVNPFDT